MRPALLLLVLGVAATTVVTRPPSLYNLPPGVDAGACTPVPVACPARLDLSELDAGNLGPRYRLVRVRGLQCADGLHLPDFQGRRVDLFRPDTCRALAPSCDGGACDEDDDAGRPRYRLGLLEHACRSDAGLCRVRLADGGLTAAPWGETLGPGYRWGEWTGAGCVRKAGDEVSGESSWPAECGAQ